MTSLEHSYVSSSLVKEIALFGGDVSAMVPPPAAARSRAAATRGARPTCRARPGGSPRVP